MFVRVEGRGASRVLADKAVQGGLVRAADGPGGNPVRLAGSLMPTTAGLARDRRWSRASATRAGFSPEPPK